MILHPCLDCQRPIGGMRRRCPACKVAYRNAYFRAWRAKRSQGQRDAEAAYQRAYQEVYHSMQPDLPGHMIDRLFQLARRQAEYARRMAQ